MREQDLEHRRDERAGLQTVLLRSARGARSDQTSAAAPRRHARGSGCRRSSPAARRRATAAASQRAVDARHVAGVHARTGPRSGGSRARASRPWRVRWCRPCTAAPRGRRRPGRRLRRGRHSRASQRHARRRRRPRCRSRTDVLESRRSPRLTLGTNSGVVTTRWPRRRRSHGAGPRRRSRKVAGVTTAPARQIAW